MAENIKANTQDVEYVTSDKATCDGPSFSKHPRVYLTLSDGDKKGEVVCPYCGKIFKNRKQHAA